MNSVTPGQAMMRERTAAAGRRAWPRWLALALLLWLLAMMASAAAAQTPVTDDDVNEVAKDLFCPVCENTPLDVCPTQACADWREVIRQQLGQGRNKQEIADYFVAQYGDGVLAAPPRRGFNLFVWLAPLIGILLGGLWFGRYLRHLKTSATDGPLPADPPLAGSRSQYLEQLETELREKE